MGKRGPSKKPSALKRIQNQRKNEITNDAVKPPIEESPQPGVDLSPLANQVFFEVSKKLQALGLLTQIDTQAFARYCDLFGKWLIYKKEVDDAPMVETWGTDENGRAIPTGWKPNPALTSYLSITDKLLKLEREFGMTPSARASIPAKTEKKEKTINDLLYGDEET